MKTPPKERVGNNGTIGLSITLEGPDSVFVEQVTAEVIKSLQKQQITVRTDKEFVSADEEVMQETLNLLDVTKAPLSLKSRSLLSVVASQHRLGLVSEAKKTGEYCVSNRSWLGEVVEALRRGKGELAGQLAFDNQGIRPDVWLVLSHERGDLYTRTAEQCGIPVLRSKKLAEAVKEVTKHITYSRTAHPQTVPSAPSQVAVSENSTETSDQSYPYPRDERLGEKVLMAYDLIMGKIYANFQEVVSALAKQLKSPDLALEAARGMLPVTLLLTDYKLPKMTALAVKATDRNGTTATLLSATPRNELDIVESRYFASSDYSSDQITEGLLHMPYDQRAKELEDFIAKSDDLGSSAIYSLEIIAPAVVLLELQNQNKDAVTLQPLTPELGYGTPALIERHDLSSLYEQAFDLSLELFSLLQSAGLEKYSYQAVLGGHYVRGRIQLPLGQLKRLMKTVDDPYFVLLRDKLIAAVSDVHPLVGSLLTKPTEPAKPTAPKKKPAKKQKRPRK